MIKTNIAIDLGTTNTVVAQWNDDNNAPEILRIESICRSNSVKDKEIDDSFTIPSCLYLQPPEERYGFPLKYIFKNSKKRTGAYIGMQAIEKDGGSYDNCFVNNFKSHLGKNSYQTLGRLKKWSFNADEISRIFVNELIAELKGSMKIKPVSATFCVPVDFYEFYRAKLQEIAALLNINKVKTIDEPVAAALGYGLCVEDHKNILVMDFGGGTLDFALIRTDEKTGESGTCSVLAKEGVPVGGNLIDAWIVEDICSHYSYNFDRFSKDAAIRWWYRMLLSEACYLKEKLFFKDSEIFYLMPSAIMNEYIRTLPGNKRELKKPMTYTRERLTKLLEKRGLYHILDNLTNSVLKTAKSKGLKNNRIDDVLMVGGSTLLPGVYSVIEKKFGRDRVRAWQPFNAVAFGAAAFAANKYQKTDYITHDYALVTYDRKTHDPEYNIIVPRGTVFPTQKDFWKRQLSPTCALGEPERIFKLIVYEIGSKHSFDQEFVWDHNGDLHMVKDGDDEALIIPLNESDPTLGYLNPPHYPSDKRARVEVSFLVNEDRWLCTSVYDLSTQKDLLIEKPVIRLK